MSADARRATINTAARRIARSILVEQDIDDITEAHSVEWEKLTLACGYPSSEEMTAFDQAHQRLEKTLTGSLQKDFVYVANTMVTEMGAKQEAAFALGLLLGGLTAGGAR